MPALHVVFFASLALLIAVFLGATRNSKNGEFRPPTARWVVVTGGGLFAVVTICAIVWVVGLLPYISL